MRTITMTEAKSIVGGASWECTQCGYQSHFHGFTSTASERAYQHEYRYGHYGKTRVQ